MRLRALLHVLAAAFAALCFHSCKTAGKAVEPNKKEAITTIWSRVRVPVTLRVSSPAKLSVGATVTMIRDTSLTVSAKVLGMEVFVAQATNDSVLVVDKMHRQYFAQNITEFLANLPFNASTVQDILTGHPVEIPKRILPDGASVNKEMNGEMLGKISFDNRGVTTVSLTYPQSVTTPYGLMAESTEISVESKKTDKSLKATIEWQWSKARWNNDVEPREIKLSDKYSRIDAENISKILSVK